ncbi:OmpP1/FadL family transporter [Desulfogranum mediterraneum]|uniref:OmpP1/FadL family transporter n=1 Tax=Desulfogranum mediterraneum TaxID=160661 RepID=UPI0009FD40A0|nr:outer membrane protein transport protein [Desulfogranum mediterraneum]
MPTLQENTIFLQLQLGWLTALVLLLISGSAHCSGFRIANQSAAAVGLAGAHVAYTPGADAAYYNPANLGLLSEGAQAEAGLTLLQLPAIDYSDRRSPLLDGSSAEELFVLPLLHLVSPRYNELRFAFSLTAPFGLAKQWEQPYPRMSARDFSLQVFEANPTLCYSINQSLSVAGGLRLLYGRGKVENLVTNPPGAEIAPLSSLGRSLDGDGFDYGYNLAVSFQPNPGFRLATTYRSEVELELEGEALLQALAGSVSAARYRGGGSLAVPLPAVWAVAAAWTWEDLTVELVWDRTFWSVFKEIDTNFDQAITSPPLAVFNLPLSKEWQDSDAFRLGIWYDWSDRLTTTLGIALEETPVPAETLGFELPDADALVYSLGIRYHYSQQLSIGLSYMYHHTKNRSLTNPGAAGIAGVDGTFSGGGAHALTLGLSRIF